MPKVMLLVLDGWGLSPNLKGNAPLEANTPVMDYIYSSYPKTSLAASGLEVGLSSGEPGNSEVGHLNIGSGRVIWESLPRIDQAISSGELAKSRELKESFAHASGKESALHLVGVVSDGGVHGHIKHLTYLVDLAAKAGVKNILVHFISDGRDTAPNQAQDFVEELEVLFSKLGRGRIATMVGRYYAMDRDKNWDREKKAYDLFIQNAGVTYSTATEAIKANYKNGKSDEFFEPSVIGEGGSVKSGDSLIMFNYRSDRSRQLMDLFCGQEAGVVLKNLNILTMTEYRKGQKPAVLFSPANMEDTLSEIISSRGLSQFHTAETEKFAHVTYFFKGGKEKVLAGEVDQIVPSKKVSAYDKLPSMSAELVTGKIKLAIKENFNFIVANYANGDMVGHTGVFGAAVKACESVDSCLGAVLKDASMAGYRVFITADHGNCEEMINFKTGQPNKEHTTNPVPFVYLDLIKRPFDFSKVSFSKSQYEQFSEGTPIGVLADIAPSVLANLDIGMPKLMSGMDLSIAMI